MLGELATLRRYERLRRPHNSLMMHSFSLMNWLFAGDFAAFRPAAKFAAKACIKWVKIKPLMRFLRKKRQWAVNENLYL